MVTPEMCLKKYGNPEGHNNMATWIVPQELRIPEFPSKIYCNKDIIEPLSNALKNIIRANAQKYFKSFDGCFNIRNQRGSSSMSLHSWGIAIDINAEENKLGENPIISHELVKCFTDAGFDWGGNWKRKDGMHFQLSKI